ncbi:PP2C family protein-serine/threonine phosphatase [Nocardioides insulae]|uniref:PP2C family protein-serine/threonine phosphatase n=1 Tax=Nocardioides insulae TaxID=394734 RepID=UPI0003F9892B|nr:PP2C family protein-serine/threonine phosphatase [Nocardioides insulae]
MTNQTVRTQRPRLRRRLAAPETRVIGWLALFGLAILVAVLLAPGAVPVGCFAVPLLLGSMTLGPRVLPWYVVYIMALLLVSVVVVTARDLAISELTMGAIGVVFLLGVIVLMVSFRRVRLGVAGIIGESMFVELRDRILDQGAVPDLPRGWQAHSALASAGGTLFAGDFVVASCPAPGRFELALVDVSGKGQDAGTRALQLSGAFGALLGALPADRFLPAANDYLNRQGWDEGFATAVHLSVDLCSSRFEVRTAGHPPAVLLGPAGSWRVLETEGPVLGVIPEAEFGVVRGCLAPGDTLLLYTDGMVEAPGTDIDAGISRMSERAVSALSGDLDGAAARLVDDLGSREDDRALVLLSRE